MVPALLLVAMAAFGVASAFFLRWVLHYQEPQRKIGELAVAVATAVLAVVVVLEFGGGDSPIMRPGPRVVAGVTLVISLSFLVARFVRDLPLAGVVLAPLAAVTMYALYAKSTGLAPPSSGTAGVLTVVHIGAAMLGFLLFIPTFVLSVLFLNQEHRLKTKKLDGVKLPSLLTLERNAWRLLFVGFPLFSLGILMGALWKQSAGTALLPPQHVFAGLSWWVYAIAIYRRVRTGWRGRRSALILMGAFVAAFGAVLLYAMR